MLAGNSTIAGRYAQLRPAIGRAWTSRANVTALSDQLRSEFNGYQSATGAVGVERSLGPAIWTCGVAPVRTPKV